MPHTAQHEMKDRIRRILLRQSDITPTVEPTVEPTPQLQIRNQSRISSGIHEQAATADDLRGIDTSGFPEAGQGSFMGGPFPDRTTDPRRSPWDYPRSQSSIPQGWARMMERRKKIHLNYSII